MEIRCRPQRIDHGGETRLSQLLVVFVWLCGSACSVYEPPDGETGANPFSTAAGEVGEGGDTFDGPRDESSTSSASSDASSGPGGTTTSPGATTDDSTSATTGPPPSATCDEPCASSLDCGPEETCLLTVDGKECLAQGCEACFDAGRSCLQSAACSFNECGPVDPNFSETCANPCNTTADCSGAESCLELFQVGNTCVPGACQSCFDISQSCMWNGTTCAFTGCGG